VRLNPTGKNETSFRHLASGRRQWMAYTSK